MLRRGGEVGKEWTKSLFNGHSGVYSKNTSAREAQTSEAELKNCSSFLVLSPCQCFCQVPWEQPVYESTVRIVRKVYTVDMWFEPNRRLVETRT